MESTTLLLLSYLYKVFFFTKQSLAADEVAELDIVGEELKAGTEYYILPVLRRRGGGLTMISNKRGCHLLLSKSFEVSKGLPLTFTPAAMFLLILTPSLQLKHLVPNQQYRRFRILSTPRNNRLLLLVGLKKILIEKADDDYKLVFCSKDNGVGTLSISDALQPFKVQLKKALKTTSSGTAVPVQQHPCPGKEDEGRLIAWKRDNLGGDTITGDGERVVPITEDGEDEGRFNIMETRKR
ncbi:hypothetical protein SADUNF_Sadunf04G0047500 [Salix dunnii]|uniref:Uncharacterized protein n=1 Tax=Salix dunnii TaxID=1413687 RepID=A0A835KAI9_9ROSI|nr:hypothetical protein SADUNF_Sadunf04G0047500 [Salix dunnii]